MARSTSASTDRSAGNTTFNLPAALPSAPIKQADQPAANNCSGFVPSPALPGEDSLISRRPSSLRQSIASARGVGFTGVQNLIDLMHEGLLFRKRAGRDCLALSLIRRRPCIGAVSQ